MRQSYLFVMMRVAMVWDLTEKIATLLSTSITALRSRGIESEAVVWAMGAVGH
jgi:hypothetical protein